MKGNYMPLENKLLEKIYFGSELEKLSIGSKKTISMIEEVLDNNEIEDFKEKIISETIKYFRNRNKGRFGGQVTAGDAVFIGTFIVGIKPKSVIEIGVASGQSSGYIINVANSLNLLKKGEKYLYSIDIEEFFLHSPVGQVVFIEYKSLLEFWSLFTKETSLCLEDSNNPIHEAFKKNHSTIAFIDADHRHPWPLIDVLILNKYLPKGSWILLQDIRLTERWLANSIERGVVCPTPTRGVGFVFENWLGEKISGYEMCYNMGAIKTGLDNVKLKRFVDTCKLYPFELEGDIQQYNEIIDKL